MQYKYHANIFTCNQGTFHTWQQFLCHWKQFLLTKMIMKAWTVTLATLNQKFPYYPKCIFRFYEEAGEPAYTFEYCNFVDNQLFSFDLYCQSFLQVIVVIFFCLFVERADPICLRLLWHFLRILNRSVTYWLFVAEKTSWIMLQYICMFVACSYRFWFNQMESGNLMFKNFRDNSKG